MSAELEKAVRSYIEHCQTEPAHDTWDTETGEYAPDAEGCASDWSHWEHTFERNRRFNELARLVASDFRRPTSYS